MTREPEPNESVENDEIESDDESEEESLGEAIESRARNPRDERLGRDALDDAVHADAPDDLSADAVDEIAAATPPSQFITSPFGDRRPVRDEGEMGFGGEAHSPEELIDLAIGDELQGRRGTTRDGEPHGPELGR